MKQLLNSAFVRILGGSQPPRPWASVNDTLPDLQNSSQPTQPHSIIAKSVAPSDQCLYILQTSFAVLSQFCFCGPSWAQARSNIVICINTTPTQMFYATEKPKILSKFAKCAARYYEPVVQGFNCRQLHLPGINGFRLIKLINYAMSIQIDEKTQ